jgi:hypothetical protein
VDVLYPSIPLATNVGLPAVVQLGNTIGNDVDIDTGVIEKTSVLLLYTPNI